MKAYVIKNKEGEYFVNNYEWTDKLCNAYMFEFKKDAIQIKDVCLLSKDCEIIKVTIAEGDLKQGQILINGRFNGKQMIMELQKQLAEKDKEIERLKMSILFEQEHKNKALDKLKEIRHQVCDEIREKIKKLIIEEDISYWNTDYGDRCWLYALEVDMTKILDQIEKGE